MQWYFHLRETDIIYIAGNCPGSGSDRDRTGHVSGLDGPRSDLLDPFPPGKMENLSCDR